MEQITKIIEALSNLKEFGSGHQKQIILYLGDFHYTLIMDKEKIDMGFLLISDNPKIPTRTFTWEELIKYLGELNGA